MTVCPFAAFSVLGNLGMLASVLGMGYTGMVVPYFLPLGIAYSLPATLTALAQFRSVSST